MMQVSASSSVATKSVLLRPRVNDPDRVVAAPAARAISRAPITVPQSCR